MECRYCGTWSEGDRETGCEDDVCPSCAEKDLKEDYKEWQEEDWDSYLETIQDGDDYPDLYDVMKGR